jgi:hypothetical protein
MNCDPLLDYQDEAGRSVIVYKMGLWSWSFSIDGRPHGKSFMTRSKAVRAAIIALEKKILKR